MTFPTSPVGPSRLVTVAHGTRHPTGNEVARALTEAAAARLGLPALAAYVELSAPLLADVARPDDVVVPLLLSTGFHIRHDLPEAAGDALLGRPLGPDPLLARAQAARLLEAGATPGQPVLMVAAGSSDPLATEDQALAAEQLGDAWAGPVQVATLSGLGARIEDVAAGLPAGWAMSPYLLSPGFFSRRAREEALAAGASVAADVIGVHQLVVDLLVARTEALVGARAGQSEVVR